VYSTRTSSTSISSIILSDNVTGAQTNGVYKAIRSVSNGSASVSEIRFMETDGSNNNTSISFATQSTASALTERARIDQNGNFGLGVTPATGWISTYRAYQFGTGGSLIGRSNSAGTEFSSNTYRDSNGDYRYLTSEPASSYWQYSGQHYWQTAASGTAGNVATFTQVLSVDKSKSLALEGASPQSGTGITFPATQSASSNVNTLDDYEEGDWTPAGLNVTFTVAVGRYNKIGRQVTVWWQVSWPTTSNTDAARISGLPFTVGSDTWSGGLAITNVGIAGVLAFVHNGQTNIYHRSSSNDDYLNSQFSGKFSYGCASYIV